MDTAEDFAQLQLHPVDRLQWRYEVIRPLLLFADRTPSSAPRKPRPTLKPCVISCVASTGRACSASSLTMSRIVPKGKTT